MMKKYKNVFKPITIKGVEFKNRIEVAPMVPCMATPEGWVTKELIDFYFKVLFFVIKLL